MFFERITMVFKAMLNALLGKVEDPQMMLEITYAELQRRLLSLRQQLAQKLAVEAQLKRQIEILERKNAPTSELNALEEQLKQVQAEIAELRRKLSDHEDEVGKAYTRKQVLIARDKAGRATTLVTDEILVGKAITEEGTTWDIEISPDSNDELRELRARKLALQELGGPVEVPTWMILAILIVLIVGYMVSWSYWNLFRNYF